MADRLTEKENSIKGRIVTVLAQHVGKERAIDMGELYQAVYGEPWRHKINDSGQLRKVIRSLRESGTPIGSCPQGFYLLRSDTEIADYCRRQERRALGTLKRLSMIKRISLPQYLGQLQLGIAGSKLLGSEK